MRSLARSLGVLALLLFLPAATFAQGTLTGTVRDTSGAVLPGVTVEATSPALIEKVRTAVTDDTGQYRIIDLPPGTYTLTFTLPGFTTVKRDGLQISGTQTLTVPIEMRVGGLEETIVVTGESPVVDVQNVKREIVLDSGVIQTIPATRAAGALLNATPGINVGDAALALSPTMTNFFARSSTANSGFVAGEGRYAVNGFPVTAARSGGFSSYVYDTVNAEEVAITVGGGLGESDIGGPIMNIIPKSGGNTFRGDAFLSTAGDWSRGNNLDDEIRRLNPNLRETPGIITAYDTSVSFGGPIKRDRLWFYGSFRDLSTQTAMEGIFANANAGDPSRWDWVGAPIEARLVQDRTMAIGRVTGQFGAHRVRINSEYQHRCEGTPLRVETEGCHNRGESWIGLGNNVGSPQMSPEATSTAARGYFDVPFYVNQGTWTWTATNRLVVEAGYNAFRYQPIFGQPPPDGITNLIPVTEQSNAINPATGLPYAPVANYRYRAVEMWGPAKASTDDVQATASYVTGAHNAKIGYQYRRLDILDKDVANQTQLGYRFNRGVPNAVSYYLPDFGRRTVTEQHGVFIQDSWTIGRVTLQGALRYDRASSFAPSELNGTTNTSFLNPNPITIERTPGVDAYHDLSPRAGVAWDVFGSGKTALKFNWGRYLAYAANDLPYTSTNPGFTVVRNVQNRGWQDLDRDLVVDCDLLNPSANGECAAAIGNAANFGKLGAATQVDPAVLEGWGVRPHDYQYTVTVQQELLPRVSVEGSFTHRTFHSFFVTDDLTRRGDIRSYYETYTLTAPRDPRLAGGGGYPITVFVPTAAAAAVPTQRYYMREKDLGAERDSVWDGFEITLNARLRGGLTAQVGTTTGRAKVNTCEVDVRYNQAAGLSPAGPDPRGCNNTEPWQTTLRGLASYTIPKVDVLVSAVVRSQPPMQIGATWQVPNSVIAAALGHLPPGATPTGFTNIPLTDNEHRVWADERRTQVDMRFAKVLRFGRTRTDIGVDLYNLLNTNYATGFNTTYVYDLDTAPRPAGWGTPTGIYTPRFVRLNFTVNF
ncbi:MAG TPA: TonB-dependent receptor [Vicinamibacterales bacterium]|nr:TonB-dependent receptor [Vicinamibacterales bacterium]